MRIPGLCFPVFSWHEISPNDNQTAVWRGISIWTLVDILHMMGLSADENLEIVTDTHLSNKTSHPLLTSVSEGHVDIAPFYVIMNSKRIKFIDFSVPIYYMDTVIVSSKQVPDISGDPISGIFDLTSGILILVSLFLLVCIMTLVYNYEKKDNSG